MTIPDGAESGAFFEAELEVPLDDAIDEVTAALAMEGFGVLTRIDLHRAFADKLGVDFRPYVILGACNPSLAHQALEHRSEIGLMLPCNVTVEAVGADRSRVRLVDPSTVLGGIPGNSAADLADTAEEARRRIGRVTEFLRGSA